MAVQCSRTLAVHFAPAVYRSVGSAQVLPELVKSLDIANVQCIQFVPNGIVRVTFKEVAQCDTALAGGVSFRGARLRVTPVDARTRLVYLRDLPVEVPDEPVRALFRKFGVLHSLSPQFHPGWPDVKNGTRVAKITLTKDLPSSVRIAGYDARLWYQGQPQSCPVCRQFGHRVRNCPLNGLCRRCHQPGHMARECSSRRPTFDPVPAAGVDRTMSDDEDDPDYVPSSASEPGSHSGDEEVLRSIPTSVLAARARKRSAPPADPSDESSVDLRDNELSPASTVPGPGMPESASAVVPPVASDPVPGMPESASAVVPPAPKPRKKKPRSSPTAVASSPAEFLPVPADQSPPVPDRPLVRSVSNPELSSLSCVWSRDTHTFWEATAFTGCGLKVPDSTGHPVFMDFGRLTRDIKRGRTSLEEDRFAKYVHHYGCPAASSCPAFCPGSPLKFPV